MSKKTPNERDSDRVISQESVTRGGRCPAAKRLLKFFPSTPLSVEAKTVAADA